jgi:hypothetical protein
MTSLDDAYDRRWAGLRDPRRVVAGLVLVGAGVFAVLAALVLVGVGGDSTTAKLYAGATAGAGIPAMLLGVVVVLPAKTRTRLGVLAGTTLSMLGVALFWQVYPQRWTRTADPFAFETMMLYGAGCAIALWFVFVAIATFRLRNNPQGTVHLEVIRQGSTETVRVSRDRYSELVSDGGDSVDDIQDLLDE